MTNISANISREVAPTNGWVIQAENLTKVYKMGEVEVHALNGLSLKIARGEIVSIMGPSGSGKSTLMNIIGCLDRPSSGEYILDGEPVARLSNDQLATIRNRKGRIRLSELQPAQRVPLHWQMSSSPCVIPILPKAGVRRRACT